MDNFTETVNIRIEPQTKQRLLHEAEWRQLKLSQLIRLALAEWLAVQRGAGIPITQRRRDGSSSSTRHTDIG
jgi:hypothetical protein